MAAGSPVVLRKKNHSQYFSSSVNDDDDDRIYEEIEAPKFVDFSAPERSRPDDRSWFCARIGCDQQHEEVDPDALHKSFVLRVLAARSPNVRFQKALCRQAQSRIGKCPRTAPVKSAKDRVQKLSGVASIPERIKAHPISSLRSTPIAKTRKQPIVSSKTLANPSNKQLFPPGEKTSRIAQSPKVPDPMSNKKVVPSKAALVFHTVTKVQNATTSMASQNLVTEVCSGMKKLHIGSNQKKKHLCKAPLKGANNTDLFPSKSDLHNGEEASQTQEGNDQHLPQGNDSSVMEIDGKSRDSSLVPPSLLPISVGLLQGAGDDDVHQNGVSNSENSTIEEKVCVTHFSDRREDEKDEVVMRQDNSLGLGDNKENASTWVDNKENASTCVQKTAPKKTVRDKSLSFDGNKENSSATYHRDMMNLAEGNVDHENRESPQKVVRAPKKTLHEISTPGEKYKKMKATNPKPFRFRTVERGILKEANLERKLHLNYLKETKSACNKSERSAVDPQNTITPQRRKHLENGLDPTASKPQKMMKLTLLQKPVTTSKVAESKKVPTNNGSQSGILSRHINEATACKTPNSKANTPSRLRRPATVPRGPVFHRINMPKGCTKRLQDQ